MAKQKPIRDLAESDRPQPITPSPGQMTLFDLPESVLIADHQLRSHMRKIPITRCQGDLFETGRDLPGAGEIDQQILWDVED